jgi:peptidoglycan/LPS O-acetylase OafA/YrhL
VTPWTDFGGYAHQPAWPLYLPLPLVRSGEFLLGMLLHTLVTRLPRLALNFSATHCVLVCAAIMALLAATSDERALSVAAVLVGVLIAMIYVADNAFTHLLGSRALILLGNASYALYLLQEPVHAYLGIFSPSPYLRLLGFPIALAAAILAWRFVEIPARRYLLSLIVQKREGTQIRRQTNQGAIPMQREP